MWGSRVRESARTIALLLAVTVPVAIDLAWVGRIPESVVPMTSLTALVALPLIWRDRAPAVVFWTIAALTGVGLVILSIPGLASSIMTCLPMAAGAYQLALVGRTLSTMRFALTLILLFAIDLIVLYRIAPEYAAWQGSILALVLILFAWSAGLASRQGLEAARNREQLETERARHAAHDERERIARELHDGLAHHLTALVLRAEAARARQGSRPGDSSPEAAVVAEDLAAIADDGRGAVSEITVILDVLRGVREPPGLDQLDDLVALARSNGASVHFSRTGEKTPAIAGATVYRIVQEALTNARRHGARREVDVVVDQQHRGTTIVVSNPVDATDTVDRGRDERPGLGLTGIRERVAQLGGEVWVSRTADQFTLRTWIPAE
jgi:signal transduction histidine kinase